jgi:polyferredoxin
MKTIIQSKAMKTAVILFLIVLVLIPVIAEEARACGGADITLSDDPFRDAAKVFFRNQQYLYLGDDGGQFMDASEVGISPALAEAIANRFVEVNVPAITNPVTFRKLEYVHGKLIYQFISDPLEGYNGKYHLGPVNFIVDRLVLDVDAKTGDLFLATGCGAAPGQQIYRFDPRDFKGIDLTAKPTMISNNTNFIARDTGNVITVDGRIDPDEWKDTGHRYFYLGTYKEHTSSTNHEKPFYYAEVWSQIDKDTIYFAVRTDNPYWVGLMFKDDPNLGMLGSYRDAKVMRSNGEVTDRFFTQRKDKTFFLKKDGDDNIVAKGNGQDDLYTYEFAFPLRSDDDHDISFEWGKAYNMLLLIGNTLDHYGIFTLDDAHKNHDHSKNNREHADVWASNETTIRIGSAPDRDIFGNPVHPVFASYVSGFDPSKTTHFHYAAHAIKDFARRADVSKMAGLLSVMLSFAGFGFIYVRTRRDPVLEQVIREEKDDTMAPGWLRRFTEWRYFRAVFTVPTMIFFALIIYYGLVDVQDGRRNIATVYTWTIWWSLVIVSFIVFGRFWCMMCPFAAIGDLAQKVVSLNRKLPRWLQNMGFQTLAFVILTLAFALYAFGSRPALTAWVIIGILASAVVFSVLYRRRSFCRHICPIGAVIGIYSTVAPVELRSCNEGRCERHKEKTCSDACPMLERPYEMDNNVYCNFCMKCQEACPSKNMGLRIRTFGKDIYTSVKKTPMEAVASLFLLGIVIVETLAMTSAWQPMELFVQKTLVIESGSVAYAVLFLAVVLLPVAVFTALCYLLRLSFGKDYKVREIITSFAFVFIPLGISLHLAHNMLHLFNEGPIILPATLRLLQGFGIGTSWALNWNPAPLLGMGTIFMLQMGTLIVGMILSFMFLHRVLKKYRKPLAHTCGTAAAMTAYALVIVLSGIYMLGLPMNGRHIH